MVFDKHQHFALRDASDKRLVCDRRESNPVREIGNLES